jgi:hypothetical protein
MIEVVDETAAVIDEEDENAGGGDTDFSRLLAGTNAHLRCIMPKEYWPDPNNQQQQQIIRQSLDDMYQLISQPLTCTLYVHDIPLIQIIFEISA